MTSVVIVAADSGNDLATCVERVAASTVSVEIIVSDNHSTDGSIDAIQARWKDDDRVRILRNGSNLGFGTACNRAAAIARGDTLLILNPDCRVDGDTLQRLRSVLMSDSKIGVVGATLVDEHGRYEPASRRRDPFLRRALMTKLGLSRFESNSSAFDGANKAAAATRAVEVVDAVSGALMMIPRALFQRIGGFDEGYFLHCEDLDLCKRVRDAGAAVVCANDVRVIHVKGTSSRARPVFVARQKHRGMWRWFTKFDPAARNPLLRAFVWCALWAHFAMLVPIYVLKTRRNQR
ncbi:MAG TPA: glycosyltransferase family 2 protein [Rudaea sp.]|nr:glycosyltransferase family 2 protein [Rudaea sp.]